jgi:hypothetical protein
MDQGNPLAGYRSTTAYVYDDEAAQCADVYWLKVHVPLDLSLTFRAQSLPILDLLLRLPHLTSH